MRYYDAIDFRFDENGDYVLDKSGDIADTSDDTLESLATEIKSIVRSSIGDWAKCANYAADLYEYIGEANTRDLGKLIEERIRNSLNLCRVALKEDTAVKIVPITPDTVAAFIIVKVMPTVGNKMEENGNIRLAFGFNLMRGQVISIDFPETLDYRALTE